MVSRRVHVTGRVQGVFYRAWTLEEARRLSVRGWVRNRSDGSVEAQLEGNEAAVEELIARMRKGPPDARVERLDFEETAPQHLSAFELRH